MTANTCGPIDFVFLQDLSGSYTDDLPILQAQVPNLIAATDGAGADIDFAVASFIDKPTGSFGSAGDYVYQTHVSVTTDNASVISSISGMATRSGADAPEALEIEGIAVDRLAVEATPEIKERYLGEAASAVYLIRPDQHVAARWPDYDETATQAALARAIGKE